MDITTVSSERFTIESGYRVTIQVPPQHAKEILTAVGSVTDLTYGDYDQVAFTAMVGVQQFRSLPTSRNGASGEVLEVPCTELSFVLPKGPALLTTVLAAIYATHPYEEPVIFVNELVSTRHIPGVDEENPNRFWNREALDWVPKVHR